MNESGASAFECREIIRRLEGRPHSMPMGDNYYKAILVEALTLLADKKDADRK